MIVIDSLNGYMNALPDKHFLLIQMHECSHTLVSKA